MNRKIRLSKIYVWIVCLFPILILYRSVIPLVTLIELVSIMFFVVAFTANRGKYRINTCAGILFVYLVTTFIFHSLIIIDEKYADMIGTSLRYLVLVFYLMWLTRDYFDKTYGLKCIKYIAAIATVYLGIQVLLEALFGILLPGGLPFLATVRENMRTYVDDVIKYNLSYRPRSLFGEPAHYCQYITLAIVATLYNENDDNRIKWALLFSCGILLSMSLLGIVSMAVVWTQYLIGLQIKKGKKISRLFLIVLLSLPFILIAISRVPQIRSVIEKKFLVEGGILSDNRFNSIGNVFGKVNKIERMIFGSGLASTGSFLPSYIQWGYSFGIVGVFCFILFIWLCWKRSDEIGKAIISVFLVECIGSELLLGNYFFVYFSFVLSKQRNESQLLDSRLEL